MEPLSPAQPSARVSSGFAWYAARLLRKKFAGVHLALGSSALLARATDEAHPVIACMNHPSWWDPIVGFMLARRYFNGWPFLAPMESAQWEKFGFMRRLGIFGLDHEHPGAMDAMCEYVGRCFKEHPTTVLGITPQGMFTDVRSPVRIRPGASALASRLERVSVISISVEYGFWNEQLPEVFVRAQKCDRPDTPTVSAWQRSITSTMRANADALASLVKARDPSAFEPMLAGGGSGVNPLYDLLLRLRGHEPGIALRRESP